jgi:hypothetical protein
MLRLVALFLCASSVLVAADPAPVPIFRVDLSGSPDDRAQALTRYIALLNAANQELLDQAAVSRGQDESEIVRLSTAVDHANVQLEDAQKRLLRSFIGTWDPSLTDDQQESLARRQRTSRHQLSLGIEQIQARIAVLRTQLISVRQHLHDIKVWIAANDTPLTVPESALWFSAPLYPSRSASAASLASNGAWKNGPQQYSYGFTADPASLMSVHTGTPPPLVQHDDTGLFNGQDGDRFDTTHVNR